MEILNLDHSDKGRLGREGGIRGERERRGQTLSNQKVQYRGGKEETAGKVNG